VRIWNTTLLPAEIQQRLEDRLLGREAGLVGYWPLMAIASGETVDFSPESNTGRVFGAFPTGRRLPRRVGRRNAEAYRYGEVFSVIQGATYLETFEYRTDEPILPFDEAEEAFDIIFEGLTGGRNGIPTEPITVPAQIRPLDAANDDGWRIVQARFTIPEGMTHLRYFHITRPGGVWDTLEVRRHRIEQLASTITQAEFVDDVTLSPLAGGFDQAEQALDELRPLEQEEAALIREVRELEALIAEVDPTGTLTQQITNQRETVVRLTQEQRAADLALDREELNPFNYYAEVAPNTFDGTRLQYLPGAGLSLSPRHQGNSLDLQHWKILNISQSATGRPVVRVFPRTNEANALNANNSGTGSYTGISVIPLQPVPNVVYQTWALEFLQAGDPARVQFRIRQPDSPRPVLGSYLLTVRANGTLGAEPVNSFASNGSTGDWFLINTQILHDEGRAAIAEARATFNRLNDELTEAEAILATLEARFANIDDLEPQLEAARLRLNQVQEQIRTLRQTYLDLVATVTNQPQALPVIPTASGGTVQGAILGFASPAGDITAYESIEGAVHLNFFDSRERLRTLPYDAVDEVWQPSIPGVCLEFQADGEGAYITIPQFGGEPEVGANLDVFTWEGWLRTVESNPDSVIAAYGADDRGWQIANPADLQVTVNGVTTPAQDINLADGAWHYLTVSWQRQRRQLSIYVDGTARYQQELPVEGSIPRGGTLSLGATATGANSFVGFLEEVSLWATVLSTDEIQANQNLPLSGREPGLLGYWPMADLGRDQIFDRSGNDYHGTPVGQVQFAPSTAPIGVVETDAILLVVNEYPTQEVGPTGESVALMRRFYAFLQPDEIICCRISASKALRCAGSAMPSLTPPCWATSKGRHRFPAKTSPWRTTTTELRRCSSPPRRTSALAGPAPRKPDSALTLRRCWGFLAVSKWALLS
jgi:hypothetical protein